MNGVLNSVEILDKKAQLKKEALEMINTCKQEIRMFTDEEQNRYDNIEKEIRKLNDAYKDLNESLVVENNYKPIKNTKTMEKRFSLIKTINDIAGHRNLDEVSVAVGEAGKEEMRKSGMAFGGDFQLPVEELRANEITVTAEGQDLVPTEIFDIITPIRSKNILVQAGAKFMTGLVGDVQVPVMSAGNVSWEGEIDAAGVKADTFSSVKLQPKRLTAYVDISKQLLNQDSIGVENTIRQDLVKAINAKLEATILGDGDGKEGGLTVVAPEGLFKGVNVHGASTVWSATTMAKIAEVESALDGKESSADYKYIVNPKAKAALRSAAKGNNVSESLYSNNEIDGTPALCSAYVPENLFAFGDFSNVVIGQWGAVDIVVDTVTQATKGCVRLVVNAYFDAKVLRSGSFSFGSVSTEPAQ